MRLQKKNYGIIWEFVPNDLDMGHSVDTGQYRPGGTFQMGRGFVLDFERWLGGTIITVTDLLGGTGRWNKSDRHLVTPCIAPPRYPIMMMMRTVCNDGECGD